MRPRTRVLCVCVYARAHVCLCVHLCAFALKRVCIDVYFFANLLSL